MIDLVKVLEKFYGQRVLLICERSIEAVGLVSVCLLGKEFRKIVKSNIFLSKNCFSVSNVVHVLLSEYIDYDEFELIEGIELIENG